MYFKIYTANVRAKIYRPTGLLFMSKMVDKNGGQKYERYFDYISNHINQFCMYRKISNISHTNTKT